MTLFALPLHPLPLGNLGPQCFIGAFQFCGSLLDPQFQLPAQSMERLLGLDSLGHVCGVDQDNVRRHKAVRDGQMFGVAGAPKLVQHLALE